MDREQEMVLFLTGELAKHAEQNDLGLYEVMRIVGYLTVALAESISEKGKE